MKEQQEKNLSNTGQITFKLNAEERQNIDEMVASSGLNLSEYCRIKCLLDENTLITQLKRIAELEKEVKVLKVKASCFKNPNVSSNDIVLKPSQEQRNLIERLYGDISFRINEVPPQNELEKDLSYNILYALQLFPQLEFIETEFFENKDFNYWSPIIMEVFPEMQIDSLD